MSSFLNSKKPLTGSARLEETVANAPSNLVACDKIDVMNSIFPCTLELIRMLARNFDGSNTHNEFWRELMKIAPSMQCSYGFLYEIVKCSNVEANFVDFSM